MKTSHKLLSSIALSSLCSLPGFAGAQLLKPVFAGWIRSSTCSVLVQKSSDTKAIRLTAKQAQNYPLFSGQSIKPVGAGTATLLIYGKQSTRKSTDSWLTLPADESKAPKGKDVYQEFTSRAGVARSGDEAISIWKAISLIDLQNPNTQSKFKIRARIVPKDSSHNDRKDVPTLNGLIELTDNDQFVIQVENEGDTPVYANILDIDFAGAVTLPLLPPTLLKAHSGWTQCGVLCDANVTPGFDRGIEHVRVIATDKTFDFSMLTTRQGKPGIPSFVRTDDPLKNLMLTADSSARTPSDWAIASIDFGIKLKEEAKRFTGAISATR